MFLADTISGVYACVSGRNSATHSAASAAAAISPLLRIEMRIITKPFRRRFGVTILYDRSSNKMAHIVCYTAG
jgi:hypothetical protein